MCQMPRWTPSQKLSTKEQFILKRCVNRVRKLLGFLRRHRNDLIDCPFQAEMESMYRGGGRNQLRLG